MVRGFMVVRILVIRRFMMGRGSFVALTALAVDGFRMVASAEILVEDGSVRAVEGVLFSIAVAEMVNCATGFWVGVVSIGVRGFATVERGVGILQCDWHRSDLFDFVRSLGEENRFLRFGREVSRFAVV